MPLNSTPATLFCRRGLTFLLQSLFGVNHNLKSHSYNLFFGWAIQNMPRPRGADAAGLSLRELELHPPDEEWSNMYGGGPCSDPDDMGPQDDTPKLCNSSRSTR
ncbi:hypothetical protein PS2_036522 [Malus domestica]